MHVITQNCCNDASCVPMCPVNCIHPTPDEPEYLTAEMLYIDPDTCIDCGACIDACPVNAITADYDLEPEQASFADVNARWYLDPAHKGYSPEQATPTARSFEPSLEPLRVAVVGSGPAACYAVEHLATQRGLNVRVNVFERLPVPGGLVRYGVAPDHQETKEISAGFMRSLRRSNVALHLNVEVGRDVSHEELARYHHAVIYAVGTPESRPLGVSGEDLPGSHSASEFVAWYNGHPEYADRTFDFSGERAVVVGNGNVALDVARILTADVSALARTDIALHALAQLAESRIREVVVLGRRGPAQASFTIAELTGLRELPGVKLVVDEDEASLDDVTAQAYEARRDSMDLLKVQLLHDLAGTPAGSERRIVLRFLKSPVEVLGSTQVTGVRVVRNSLVNDAGTIKARSTGDEFTIGCGLVLRSVGYQGRAVPGVPFDRGSGTVPNHHGRVVEADLEMPSPHLGVYVVGWAKRGPSGVIGTNKVCARETVDALLDDFVGGLLTPPGDKPKALHDLLSTTGAIDAAGWRAIDEHEKELGRALSSPRVKLVSVAEMLAIARQA
ncbi:MAG TPA: FAD-dependent oxidoreductase [Trebonia sp.]|nr:FAD-dependent oxidoreductase [Trebonia sp.]